MKKPRKDEGQKPPKKQTREEIIAETIEDAMRPYLGVLPEHALRTMRDILEDTMATHPVAVEALDALDPSPPVDESHTRPRGSEGGDGRKDGDDGEGAP